MLDNEIDQLEENIGQAWDMALKMGIDPFPVNFEIVPSAIMYEFGAYGLPGRFSHWTRGKAYHRMKTSYDFGLSKIYELVINTNPSYAFLLENNSVLENTFVAAHVFGHTDFFKHNAYFAHTNRSMIDRVGAHAERIRQYEFDHGRAEVERFLDAVLAIEEHIDYNFRVHRTTDDDDPILRKKSDYDDIWKLDKVRRKQEMEEDLQRRNKHKRFPKEPTKDILLFLAEHAPHLEQWQRDILQIVREEMIYFIPQMQTKVMNEGWACLVGSSLVLTERGLMRYDALHDVLAAGEHVKIGSGSGNRDSIIDRHITRNAATVRIHTRRGFVLEGAEHHKLNIGTDQWLDLKDLQIGQRIPLSVGDNIWPLELVELSQPPQASIPTMETAAMAADVGYSTVELYLNGRKTRSDQAVAVAVSDVGYKQLPKQERPLYTMRKHAHLPDCVTEELGSFLGYLVGDGNLHPANDLIGFTSGDRESVDQYAQLVENLFAITPKIFWDDQTISDEGGRWRVSFYSVNVLDWLESIGIDVQAKAYKQRIPAVILRSPKAVVSAFLRAYFDCDGCASLTNAVILSTFSDDIAQALQIILLNYGILSRRIGVNVHITGKSVVRYEQEIGFGLTSKQEKLRAFITQHQWFKEEDPFDEVVSIEHGTADVYDITVDHTHRYVANGMLHHNSIWHSRIMREFQLNDADFMRFATLHSGVLSPNRTSLNPYYLGFTIWEDIEKCWDHPGQEEIAKGRQPGQGKEKIFEVREADNDVSFLRNYLTKDLVDQLDLYLYEKQGDEWVIAEKDWRKVRDGIVAGMTNFGYPYLVIDDADFRRNSELHISHLHEGQDMDLNYATKTLQYVYQIWGRTVHLETTYEDKRILLTFDGEKHSKEVVES